MSAWDEAEKDYKAHCDHERLCDLCRDFNKHHHRCKKGQELFEQSESSLDKAQKMSTTASQENVANKLTLKERRNG